MRPRRITDGRATQCAFTLIEVLIAMAIVIFLLVVLLSMTNQVSGLFQSTKGRTEQFSEARSAFESISRKLCQVTLNTYWDYDDPQNPVEYIRQSELRFVSGRTEVLLGQATTFRPTHGVFFFAPLGVTENSATMSGLNTVLNACGYFIEYNTDADFLPTFLSSLPSPPALRSRFRLMEWAQPAEKTMIYGFTTGTNSQGKPNCEAYTGYDWFQGPLALSGTSRPVRILAENVIALVLLPRLSTQMLAKMGFPNEAAGNAALSPTYLYDSTSIGGATTAAATNLSALNSKNQLPPFVQLTLVAIDDVSAARMSTGTVQNLQDKLKSLFSIASNFDADLKRDSTTYTDVTADPSLEGFLIKNKIGYRIFTTNIMIQESKWSTQQTN